MFTTRRERKKEKTRLEVTQCAVKLFKEKGFAETAIEEITEQADISKGTLYNYFPDKESILVAYFQNKIAEASPDVYARLVGKENIETKLGVLMDFMSHIVTNDLDLVGVYFSHRLKNLGAPQEASQRSGIEHLLVEMIKSAQVSHELRDDLPAVVIARNFNFLFMSFFIFHREAKQPLKSPFDKKTVIELFLYGAAAKR